MPEDPAILGDALAEMAWTLIGGVVFRPFHDPAKWDEVMDAAVAPARRWWRMAREHLVLIDSISPRRAPTAGRAEEAEQMDKAEWTAFRDRIATVARLGAEEYGLTVGIHAHAAGFIDFEPELERLLDEVDERLLKICFDTGHHSYAGFDPVAFMKRHIGRISYMHFKDIDPAVKADVIAKARDSMTPAARASSATSARGMWISRRAADPAGRRFQGWCTVEQDCDPTLDVRPHRRCAAEPRVSESIGF
jgi:inosose dehydratase